MDFGAFVEDDQGVVLVHLDQARRVLPGGKIEHVPVILLLELVGAAREDQQGVVGAVVDLEREIAGPVDPDTDNRTVLDPA